MPEEGDDQQNQSDLEGHASATLSADKEFIEDKAAQEKRLLAGRQAPLTSTSQQQQKEEKEEKEVKATGEGDKQKEEANRAQAPTTVKPGSTFFETLMKRLIAFLTGVAAAALKRVVEPVIKAVKAVGGVMGFGKGDGKESSKATPGGSTPASAPPISDASASVSKSPASAPTSAPPVTLSSAASPAANSSLTAAFNSVQSGVAALNASGSTVPASKKKITLTSPSSSTLPAYARVVGNSPTLAAMAKPAPILTGPGPAAGPDAASKTPVATPTSSRKNR
jgi:hypothetical protein